MNTFEIVSWVLGTQRKIIVTEPMTWNGTEFKLRFDQNAASDDLIIKLENGNWQPVLSSKETTTLILPKQLEIDSIGFQIAKHWCGRLEQQLMNFQICI